MKKLFIACALFTIWLIICFEAQSFSGELLTETASGSDILTQSGSDLLTELDAPVEGEDEDNEQEEIISFIDINDYRYQTAIKYLADKRVVEGYDDGSFQAEKTINRAEFTKILIEATDSSFAEVEKFYQTSCFTDVPDEQWFTPYICLAKAKKIINGYEDGSFQPAAEINLVEALKIIVNAFALEKGAEGANWYEVYVMAMGNSNYIPSTLAGLEQKITRGEMSEMIWRVLEQKKEQDFTETSSLMTVVNNSSDDWQQDINGDCLPIGENVPANVNMNKIRATWLGFYNDLRAAEGKHQYVYNTQLNRSATAWAEAMKAKGVMDHKRPGQTAYYDYNMITDWFADQGLVFKNVNRVTHTENIGWGGFYCNNADDCTDDVLTAIRGTLDFYLAEKGQSYQPHYQSVMNDYFQEIGLGLAFEEGKYYLVVHYGTDIISDPLPVCQ